MDLNLYKDDIIAILETTGGNIPEAMKKIRLKTHCDLDTAFNYCEDMWEIIQSAKVQNDDFGDIRYNLNHIYRE